MILPEYTSISAYKETGEFLFLVYFACFLQVPLHGLVAVFPGHIHLCDQYMFQCAVKRNQKLVILTSILLGFIAKLL